MDEFAASRAGATFQSRAYGLNISANREVPGLVGVASEGAPDLRLWLGIVPPPFVDDMRSFSNFPTAGLGIKSSDESGVAAWEEAAFVRVCYVDETQFFVDAVRGEIWSTWPSALTIEDTATYLLGPILSLYLRLCGATTLHASAVRIGDVAVALVGPQGAGKSTTAASFALAGYPVLTDDVALLTENGAGFRVVPAYPRIRLWPSSVEMLLGSPDGLPLLTPNWDKCYLELGGDYRFESDPVPLGAVYFLHPRSDDPNAQVIEQMPLRRAMVEIIGNLSGNYLLDEALPATSLGFIQRLTHGVAMRRVIASTNPACLPQLRDLIVADLKTSMAMDAASADRTTHHV